MGSTETKDIIVDLVRCSSFHDVIKVLLKQKDWNQRKLAAVLDDMDTGLLSHILDEDRVTPDYIERVLEPFLVDLETPNTVALVLRKLKIRPGINDLRTEVLQRLTRKLPNSIEPSVASAAFSPEAERMEAMKIASKQFAIKDTQRFYQKLDRLYHAWEQRLQDDVEVMQAIQELEDEFTEE